MLSVICFYIINLFHLLFYLVILPRNRPWGHIYISSLSLWYRIAFCICFFFLFFNLRQFCRLFSMFVVVSLGSLRTSPLVQLCVWRVTSVSGAVLDIWPSVPAGRVGWKLILNKEERGGARKKLICWEVRVQILAKFLNNIRVFLRKKGPSYIFLVIIEIRRLLYHAKFILNKKISLTEF